MSEPTITLSMEKRRHVTLCNHNFSKEGVLHPDRVMDEYDLLYMQDGEWDIIEDDISYHVSPGSVLLLEPGKHHYSTEKCSPMMRNVYVHFQVEEGDEPLAQQKDVRLIRQDNDMFSAKISSLTLGETSASSSYFASGEPSGSVSPAVLPEGAESRRSGETRYAKQGRHPSSLDSHLRIPKLIQTADHKEVRHGFEKVVDAFWSREDTAKELRCSLALEALLLTLADLAISADRKTDILVSEMIHRFHVEPERFLSPEELADNYKVSVRTISGRFKEKTGMSIHQYQIQIKLDMAYDLLPISPGRSLHDIATSYGFYDEFQFSKLFKRQFGISPSQRR